ncbi:MULTISPECIES: murein hydrolase activator EnvC family protein [Roseivirga]|jgi:septal ring factor EnvC (AmiA/AmiB activator)|uniref:Peptidase M23 n=1 Tax=Roseivirga thermotolerans TaxID=1758176 RepID=A0ABQ3I6I5_9BACT|nr:MULTISPECIES: peptidoglycan DD-metalloendopeptidase family protein [Roseivirga]MEC7753147.1 peptidoglycan DD-metalloendopeptidase family protein [Bacteroidota bacterium]GHE58984.1 peptidase M23 [Roseivirga thermotolerans]|tara:strand:+ start:1786 stop:2988 length:1203 start_codon:yes stop_codon:yes gene_type:complete
MRSANKSVLLTLFFVLALSWSNTLLAQNERDKLEKQKAEILRKIKENEKILNQTTEKRSTSLGRLKALNNQISSRASLIKAINSEVDLLDAEIAENQSIVNAMERDLQALKKEYGQMIYATQKTSSGFNQLTFLFSSSTFNQLFMRMRYIRQYGDARKKQVRQIEIVQQNLNEQIAEVARQKEQKQALLNDELSENQKLQGLQLEQKKLIAQLEQQENRIKKELEKQRESERELTSRIEDIIEAERRAAALANVDMKALSTAFEQQRGKLPWPVDEGFVSSKYGLHAHPTLKRVEINNKGIDIQTSSNATVKAVFPGKVIGVMSIPGQGITVILQHGDYFTSYSKLKAVTVKKDQQVQAGDVLGQVLTNNENVSEMKFRINATNGTVNPETWLQRKNNKP